MKKKEPLFSEVYRKDPQTGMFIIEIALDNYEELFNEWDPAPFKNRDIDPDLTFYLEGCSDDIPLRYPVSIHFVLPFEAMNRQKEEHAKKGLRNGFRFMMYLTKKEIKKSNQRIFLFFLIGFLFLTAATLFPVDLLEGLFPGIMLEGLFIGGWVFIWEAITLILFTFKDQYHQLRTYRRLHKAPITFSPPILGPELP